MGQKLYKPRHKKTNFKPNRVMSLERDKRQALYQSKAWTEYRAVFLRENRLCYSCGNKSEAVDHIRPHRGDEPWFWKEGNYLPLCHRCHNTATMKFERNQGDCTKAAEEKVAWLNDQRERNQIRKDKKFPKVKIVPIRIKK